jgi:hypothetical protein
MSTLVTVADQRRALDFLIQLAGRFPNLPPLHVNLMGHTPDKLHLYLHDDLADFEAWRQALGIPGESISCGPLSTDKMQLAGRGTFDGIDIELHGFAPALPEATTGGTA